MKTIDDSLPPSTQLEPFRETFTTANGTVSYIDVGSGPVALFIHGAATNAYLWRNVVLGVAGPERRCIALDLPLHGKSPLERGQPLGLAAFAELIEEFCAELGLVDLDLVAGDTGGAIAQILAARHPERFHTFTLTNCETHDNVPPLLVKPAIAMARLGILSRTGPRLLANPEKARRRVFGSGFEDIEKLPLDVARSYLEPVIGTRERAREFERWLLSVRAEDLLAVEPDLRRLPTPTLVVWGTGDRFFSVRWARWLTETLPNVTRLELLEGARLFFPDERAHSLVAALRAHWGAAVSGPEAMISAGCASDMS